jgi:dinuclear metal center YbgI/SA1388 family protein
MIKRDTLTKFLNNYFGEELIGEARKKDEHMPNGLQWLGKEEIKKLAIGVSANVDFFKEAVKTCADAVLVHHAMAIDVPFNIFSNSLQKRLKFLAKNNLSLYGYHYILDSHPKIGNNVQIIKALGAKKTKQTIHEGWGWIGEFAKKQDIDKLAKKCAKIFSHDVFVVKSGKDEVKRIGVVSGRGMPFKEKKLELVEKEVELYISGEISEWNPAEFKEMGICYFACGHYATEVFGVQALGKVIKKEFREKLEVEFIDIPNPL